METPWNIPLETRSHPSGTARTLSVIVAAGDEGLTVEQTLRERLHISRTLIRAAKFMENGICADGRRIASAAPVSAGQRLTIVVSDSAEDVAACTIEPQAAADVRERELDILFEDEDVLVLDKPANVAMYPSAIHPSGTLANLVLGHYRRTGQEILFHPVHRLDYGTSGLLVLAKHAYAQERLSASLHTDRFVRRYTALCHGVPEPAEGIIDVPILRVKDGGLFRSVVAPEGKPARTAYRVEAAGSAISQLTCQLFTGRTHQIRVHLAHVGHPLFGDTLYGQPFAESGTGTENEAPLGRPALHSSYLVFDHPVTGERLRFTAPLPDDLRNYAPYPQEQELPAKERQGSAPAQ